MPSPNTPTPWSDRRHRHRRDRVRYECGNCSASCYAKPDLALLCGQCFLALKEVRPAGYPALPQGRTIVNRPKVQPADLPLEDLALPPHIRTVVEHALTTPPAMPAAPVVITPVEQPTHTPVERPTAARSASPRLYPDSSWSLVLLAEMEHHIARGTKPALIVRYVLDRHTKEGHDVPWRGFDGFWATRLGVSGQAVWQTRRRWEAEQAQQATQLEVAA